MTAFAQPCAWFSRGPTVFTLLLFSCAGPDSATTGSPAMGGSANNGSGQGGATNAAGAETGGLGVGGNSSTTGGQSSSGGSQNHESGGAFAVQGGKSSTGGTPASTGGSSSATTTKGGGSDSGGTSTAKGGTSSKAGASSIGGNSSNSGGAPTLSGGSKGSGGTSAGAIASGGTQATGGAATGTGGASSSGTSSTVANGLPALHVEGTKIVDPNGKTIVLRGASLIDIGALWSYSSKSSSGITARIDALLSAGLQLHVVRLPVYPRTCFNTGGSPYNSPAPYPVGTAGGTQTALTSDEYVEKLLKPAVDYATQKGMYVIIDYHQIDNTNGQSATDATTFWTYMAGKFASYTNVLYEAFNEPIDGSAAWSTLKPRVQAWVDAIRKDAPNNIIIVPSMSYDQKPGDAASSPPTGSNFVFTAHVYPGNWNSNFKQQVATAVTKAPVFFTEWGYVLNGSDANLGTSSSTWGSDFRTQVDGNGASWTAWVADNSWTPNMFSDTGIKTLTAFGSTTKDWLSAKAASDWVK